MLKNLAIIAMYAFVFIRYCATAATHITAAVLIKGHTAKCIKCNNALHG